MEGKTFVLLISQCNKFVTSFYEGIDVLPLIEAPADHEADFYVDEEQTPKSIILKLRRVANLPIRAEDDSLILGTRYIDFPEHSVLIET